MVKLAYNEDDDKHYVSRRNCFHISGSWLRLAAEDATRPQPSSESSSSFPASKSLTPVLLIFFFYFIFCWEHNKCFIYMVVCGEFCPLKLHHLGNESGFWCHLKCSQDSLFKAVLLVLCVPGTAALRSVHQGLSVYEPALWREVILGFSIAEICPAHLGPSKCKPFYVWTRLSRPYSNNNKRLGMRHAGRRCQPWLGLRCTFELEPVGALSRAKAGIENCSL